MSAAAEEKKILVLVADDEANLLMLVKDNLEENGYTVVTAVNGQEALEAVVREKPNIVILDVEMPKLNGWQVCREIRKISEFEKLPILILSAYAQPEDIRRGLEAGANQYMTKPFKMKELIGSLRSIFSEGGEEKKE